MLSGAIITNLHYIWYQIRITIKRINAEPAPFKGAIWYKFSSQHQHQTIKKRTIFNAQIHLLEKAKWVSKLYKGVISNFSVI